MTDFNPDAFLATETADANDTMEPSLPKGEYAGTIEGIKANPYQPPDGGDEILYVTIQWRLNDEKISEIFGNDRGWLADQRIRIETTNGRASGPIATGKGRNAQLGRLREALGQNKPGKPWSFSMLIGQSARVTAESEDGTGDYEGRRFYRVKAVQPL